MSGFAFAFGVWIGLLVLGSVFLLAWWWVEKIRSWLDDRDRHRHVGECSERERFERGAAFAEAMDLTLLEIRSLRETPPRRSFV